MLELNAVAKNCQLDHKSMGYYIKRSICSYDMVSNRLHAARGGHYVSMHARITRLHTHTVTGTGLWILATTEMGFANHIYGNKIE